MPTPSRDEGAQPSPASLAEVQDLYDRGLCIQAWRAAKPIGPLTTWRGLPARILAGRLANQLGNSRLGGLLLLRAHRAHPDSEEAWTWAVDVVAERLGAYAALLMLRRGRPSSELSARALAQRARVAARLRDFDDAMPHLERAEQLDPDSAWIQVERSAVLELADDYPGALEAATRALAVHPWYAPAVERRARMLVLLDREDEALALLHEANGKLESFRVASSLLQLQEERGLHPKAEALLGTPEAARAVGRLWARRCLHGPRSVAISRIDGALAGARETKALRGAASECLEHLAASEGPAWLRRRRITRWVRRHAAWLGTDAGTWGSVGYALNKAALRREVIRWMSGWRERDGREPWMLLNLAGALRDLDRIAEAREVSEAALGLARDEFSASHEVFIAADAALAGEPAPPRGTSGRDALSPYYRCLHEMTQALLRGLQGEDDRRAAWKEALAHLAAAAAVPGAWRGYPSLRRFRRRSAWALARRRAGGGPLTFLWFLAAVRVAGALRAR